VAAVAEPAVDEDDKLTVEPPIDVADGAAELPPTPLAFNLPHTNEWQKA
jgi:hypothetical protein